MEAKDITVTIIMAIIDNIKTRIEDTTQENTMASHNMKNIGIKNKEIIGDNL